MKQPVKRLVEIPNPCTEDWEQMKIGVRSRFCDSCQKNVKDFTQMDRREILEYLLLNRNQQVCGRINPSQMDFSHSDILVTIRSLSHHHKNTDLSFYILTIGALMLSGCSDSPQAAKNDAITLEFSPQDSVNVDTTSQQCTTSSIGKPTLKTVEASDVMPTMGAPVISPPLPVEQLLGDIIYVEPSKPAEDKVYQFPEVMPKFKGGVDSLMQYIQQNLVYPERERKKRIEGTVYAKFIIDKEGKITQPQIIRSVPKSKNFDREVIRVIRSMPDWTPGKQNGYPVDTEFNLPIQFKL